MDEPQISQVSKRGGKRAGAGRTLLAPDAGPAVTVSSRVERILKEFAQSQPEGESAYIRRLLTEAHIKSLIV